MLESSPDTGPRMPVGGWVSQAEFDSLREAFAEAQRPESKSALSSALVDPQFKEKIEGTLQAIQLEKAEAKRAQARVDRVARLDKGMPVLQARLGLTQPQSDQLRSEFEAHYDRNQEMVALWESTGDSQAAGALKASNHELHQGTLAEILNPTQLEDLRPALREAGIGRGK